MSRNLSLQDHVRYIKGVGPKRAELFKSLGIETVGQLLDYLPFRVDDYSKIKKLKQLRSGDTVTVFGKIVSSSVIPSMRGRALQVEISDGSGTCHLVWYNMIYLSKQLRPGLSVVASGKVEWRRGGWEIAHPLWQKADILSRRGPIIPIYHGRAGLNSSTISRIVSQALSTYKGVITEILPAYIILKYKLVSEKRAYKDIHNPPNFSAWLKARNTFAFRESLFLQLALLLMKSKNRNAGPVKPYDKFVLSREFVDNLPFELTEAQNKVIGEIESDLKAGKTMNRLVQGDVGSGKTVIAIWALLAAVANGYQAALLAPTEVLARQHMDTIMGAVPAGVRIGFLSGSQSVKDKRQCLKQLAEGTVDILVGTHAMIEPHVEWHRLGMVVTDEQHRFGVKQRLKLSYDTCAPHMLVMSATPIPRSLAITLFGDLDLSVIDELPPGRQPVITKVLEPRFRNVAYQTIEKQLAKGHQVYVVCPLIAEGKSGRSSVEQMFKKIKHVYLKNAKIGFAHSDMNKVEFSRQIQDFIRGKTQVLVATTVIEVGVDVTNATCIVIEGAEAFGLATLHQLRGRVGRGSEQSYCFLIPSDEALKLPSRLKALESMHDGFSLAELDLRQRGPGQFFGLKQHGLSDIDMEALGITPDILRLARQEALEIVTKIEDDRQIPFDFFMLLEQMNARFGNLFKHARSR